MTSQSITPGRVEDLIAVLESALESARRVSHEIRNGDITPEEAADILNESVDSIIISNR